MSESAGASQELGLQKAMELLPISPLAAYVLVIVPSSCSNSCIRTFSQRSIVDSQFYGVSFMLKPIERFGNGGQFTVIMSILFSSISISSSQNSHPLKYGFNCFFSTCFTKDAIQSWTDTSGCEPAVSSISFISSLVCWTISSTDYYYAITFFNAA